MRKKKQVIIKKKKKGINLNKIELSYLNECLNYDHNTGIILWKERPVSHFKDGIKWSAQQNCNRWNAKCLNKEAGGLDEGYIRIKIRKKLHLAHRLAWAIHYGYYPENEIDHKDRIKHHNWILNLRESSRTCNIRNTGVSSNNTSGVKGVGFHKRDKVYYAQINVNKKRISLGTFEIFDRAVFTRWDAEKKYNFPNCNTSSSSYNYLKNKGLI